MKIARAFLPLLASGFWLLASVSPSRADEQIPPQVQSAVDRGLDWLAKNQSSTGGWSPGAARPPSAAVTSLAAMAFMSRGHTPGQGPYGEHINRAVDFILALQEPDGTLAHRNLPHPMYDHGISTVMLCEAYGMLDEKRQRAALPAISSAVRLILNAQSIRKSPTDQGGWRYTPTANDSDISVSGWQLMALRGAANIGANVPPRAIEAGIAFVKRRAEPNGGFGYINSRVNPALTGTGITALELLGQHNSREALAGGDYLLAQRLEKGQPLEFYFYTVYYCSQAAWQLGGRYWEAIDPVIRKSLLEKQLANGAWQVSSAEQQGGEPYGTAMAVLALTVPYRYLPIYQR